MTIFRILIDRILKRIRGGTNTPNATFVENGILKGKGGWLFLWDGSNEVHRYYTDSSYFTEEDARLWVELLKERKSRIEALGATYRHLNVPDKISVYPQHLPVSLPLKGAHPAAQLAKLMVNEEAYVDILPDLLGTRSATSEMVVFSDKDTHGSDAYFFKTDSHWKFEGCQVGYLRLCESLDTIPCDLSDRLPGEGIDMTLDLGSKLSQPIFERGRFGRVLRDSKRVNENEIIRYNEAEGLANGNPRFVGSAIHNRNESPKAISKTVVLFGDSFSEFRPHLLTAMLSETFRDVYFIWSTNLDYDFLERISPDIVITEIAERFCKRIPKDQFTVELAS